MRLKVKLGLDLALQSNIKQDNYMPSILLSDYINLEIIKFK